MLKKKHSREVKVNIHFVYNEDRSRIKIPSIGINVLCQRTEYPKRCEQKIKP